MTKMTQTDDSTILVDEVFPVGHHGNRVMVSLVGQDYLLSPDVARETAKALTAAAKVAQEAAKQYVSFCLVIERNSDEGSGTSTMFDGADETLARMAYRAAAEQGEWAAGRSDTALRDDILLVRLEGMVDDGPNHDDDDEIETLQFWIHPRS